MYDLPTYPDYATPVAPMPPPVQGSPNSNAFVAGIKSGSYGLLGALSGAASGASKLVGAGGASDYFGQKAQQFAGDATQVGRPDIDRNGWTGGGLGGFASKLAYTAGQSLPTLVGAGVAAAAAPEALGLGAAGALGGAGAEAAEALGSSLIGRAGAALPSWLGGGANLAGARTAASMLGAGAVTVPQSFGEQVNAASQQPGGLTWGNAARAAVQAVPAGLAQAIVPGEGAILARGGESLMTRFGTGTLANVADHGIKNAAIGAIGSGIQTAADDSFNPNLTAGERATNIVQAAAGGAVAGGLIGGIFGLRGKPPTPENLAAEVDKGLAQVQMLQLPAPANTLRTMDGRIFDMTPRPQAPGVPEAPGPELPLEAPPAAVQGPGQPQFNLFGQGPYDAGVAPIRTRAEAMAAVRAARAANAPAAPEAAPAAPGTLAIKAPDAPPPNAFAQQTLKDGKIQVGRGKSPFKDFIANSTATNMPELYNELAAVPADHKIAQSSGFQRLATKLGVGVPDLEAQAAKAEGPKLALLKDQIALRDAAAQLKQQRDAQQAADLAEQVAKAKAAEAAPPAAPIAAVPMQEDIPELLDQDAATTPAVKGAAAAEPAIHTLGPEVPSSPAEVPSSGPVAITDRVIAAARSAVGAKGGEVDIAQLRAALPDVAAKDIDAALREIHTDDTDHTLTQAPKGQRTNVDGVSVPGAGRFHKLDLAPQEAAPDAAEVGSAAPQAAADQSGGAAPAGGGDAAGQQAAGAAAPETGAGQPGPTEAPVAADQGAAAPALANDNVDEPFVPATRGDQAKIKRAQAKLKGVPYQDLWSGYFTAKAGGDKETAAAYARELGDKSPTGEFPDPHTVMREQIRFDNAQQAAAPDGVTPEQAAAWAASRPRTDEEFAAERERPPLPGHTVGIKETSPGVFRLTYDGSTLGDSRGYSRDKAIAEAQKAVAQRGFDLEARRPTVNTLDPALTARQPVPMRPVTDTTHPIVEAKNQLASFINGLPDQDHADLTKAYGNLSNVVGNSADPIKQMGLMQSDLAHMQAARATEAKLAPQDPTTRSPEQAVQSQAKTEATANLLAAPAVAKDAGKVVTTKLRRQTKAKTAVVETPNGDQIPTAAVGGDVSELPQVMATSADPVLTAAAPAPMVKQPFGRVPGLATPPTIDRAQVDAHVAKFAAKLRPEIQGKIHVVDSAAELPPGIQAAVAAAGGDAPAVFHAGEVYLQASQMRNLGEVEDALSHEVFGHMATAARYANATDYQSAMTRVFERIGGADGIEKMARKLGVWSPAEDGGKLQGGAGLSAYLPTNDRGSMTPLEKTRVLDELIAHRAAATPGPVDAAIQQLQDATRKGIVNTLRRAGMSNFAARLDKFTATDLSKWLADSRKALAEPPKPGDIDLAAGSSDPRLFLHDSDPSGEAPFLFKLGAAQRDSQGVMGLVGSLRDHILNSAAVKDLFRPAEPGTKPGIGEVSRNAVRTIIDSIAPATHFIEQAVRRGMAGLKEHYDLKTEVQNPIATRLAQMSNAVFQKHMDLKSADEVQWKRLNKVMDIATRENLDPTRPFDQHDWHTGSESEEITRLAAAHADLQKEFNALGTQGKGGKITNGQQIFKEQAALGRANWYMARAMLTRDTLDTVFKGKADLGYEPARRYAGIDPSFVDSRGRQLANSHFGDVAKGEAYWKAEFNRHQQIAADLSMGEGSRPENVKSPAYTDLAQMIRDNKQGEDGYVKQGPYFRLGRQGEYAVGFKVPMDEDGNVDQDKLAAIKAGYAKDFPQLSIGNSPSSGQVFARFPSEDLAKQFAAKVLQGGELRRHIDQEAGVHTSLLTAPSGLDKAVPFLQQHLDAAAAQFNEDLAKMDPASEEAKVLAGQRDRYLGNLRATILDLSGDNSSRSIQARRDNTQGSSLDMLDNQRGMANTYNQAAASAAVRVDKANALFSARQSIDAAGRSQSPTSVADAAELKRLYNAYEDRNKAADVRVGNSFLSAVKSGLHTFTLGASPSYIIMNLSQLGTLGLPELGKFHGFARATGSMIRSSNDANKVIAAMVRTGGAVEGGITNAVLDSLRKGGMSEAKLNFLTTLVNHDHIELGSYTSVNSGLGVGNLGRIGRWQQYANSTALLAETYSRLIMGFAAKDLHDTMPEGSSKQSLLRQFPTAESYAGHVIPETMMRWGSDTTPKLFTAGGAMGKYGPVVTQFHGWVPRLVEKLYRETTDGFTQRLGKGPEADAQRAEARRFMFSHLAAVTAIAGGLGLPFAGYAAGAATRLSGLVSDQPVDVEAGIRGFMTNTFGKEFGEILSRGLPRYLGADMANLGDNDFLPLAKLMEDRRKLEDAVPDYLAHAWGSAPGMAMNAMLGMRELVDGRFSEAGARALPTALRNLVRAYRVDQYGYMTSTGEKLPVPAGGLEVLKTALGVQGGRMAEERDHQNTYAGLQDDRQFRASLIKKDIALAHTKGDSAGFSAAMEKARQYDLDNPGERLSASIPGFLQSRQKAEAYGQQFGTLGINPKDRLARERTNY